MQSNLFKPQAQHKRNVKEIRDILISFAVLLLFVLAVIYIGYRAAEIETVNPTVKSK